MSLLVTGFEPFLGELVNPSAKLIADLPGHIDSLLLPVSYKESFSLLRDFLEDQAANNSKTYSAILMLGQAGGRDKISLERTALNWRESTFADETGFYPEHGQKILPEAENAYFSSLPLERIKRALENDNIPVEISFSAGAFVCNSLFFETAAYLKSSKTLCGFVHVPYLPEQTISRPSMEYSLMQRALIIMLECLMLESGT